MPRCPSMAPAALDLPYQRQFFAPFLYPRYVISHIGYSIRLEKQRLLHVQLHNQFILFWVQRSRYCSDTSLKRYFVQVIDTPGFTRKAKTEGLDTDDVGGQYESTRRATKLFMSGDVAFWFASRVATLVKWYMFMKNYTHICDEVEMNTFWAKSAKRSKRLHDRTTLAIFWARHFQNIKSQTNTTRQFFLSERRIDFE